MKLKPILLTLALLTCGYSQYSQSQVAIAENLENINRALSTNKCQSCDLRTSNLVYAKLSGADLSFSSLREANLSRADLSFANLRNVDFRGASLLGANLNGADLSGANLSSVDLSGVNFSNANLQGANFSGSDLRRAFFGGANLTGVNFSNAFLRGAVGIPIDAVSPEEYYAWATDEDKKGNHRLAIEYFNKAVVVDPKYALAYMGRAISLRQIGDVDSAIQDSDRAAALFEAQGDQKGTKLAKDLTEVMKNPPGAPGSSFGDVLTNIGSLFLQFLLR
ncbi:putative low-complexity protein [Synechococcus sp. PCC 7502]|uniref:pentapeptide repeat-containing protein n=1 Tax=Synechococcus sp. PCC 7502 TaxID=1173263 RepID=UPI00029FC411|nr:pentapeptide repeat-containing protein [Synechococcus sp. PCC 7502]AFY75194.1 putative low-complexity protein [Synechococcus sp. PCC 7502]